MKEINLYFENLVAHCILIFEFYTSKLKGQKTNNLDIEKNENYLSILKSGIISKYFPSESTDNLIELVFAGNFTSAYDFYLTKPKCIYITETISPSVMLCISYADFQSHCNINKSEKKVDSFNRIEKTTKKSKLEIALICL
jgi:hypothetical protein